MKKVPCLEQLFDAKGSRITVYKGADGRLMVTEVIGGGSFGRMYEVASLFNYAEQYRQIQEKGQLKEQLEEKIEKLKTDIALICNSTNDLNKRCLRLESKEERTPKFGWKKSVSKYD